MNGKYRAAAPFLRGSPNCLSGRKGEFRALSRLAARLSSRNKKPSKRLYIRSMPLSDVRAALRGRRGGRLPMDCKGCSIKLQFSSRNRTKLYKDLVREFTSNFICLLMKVENLLRNCVLRGAKMIGKIWNFCKFVKN